MPFFLLCVINMARVGMLKWRVCGSVLGTDVDSLLLTWILVELLLLMFETFSFMLIATPPPLGSHKLGFSLCHIHILDCNGMRTSLPNLPIVSYDKDTEITDWWRRLQSGEELTNCMLWWEHFWAERKSLLASFQIIHYRMSVAGTRLQGFILVRKATGFLLL